MSISSVRIAHNNQTGQTYRFGFAQFRTLAGYETALNLSGTIWNGKKLRIEVYKSKATLSSTASATPLEEPIRSLSIDERKTRVVHCKKSNYDVYIGRPSIWGNPFVHDRDGDKPDRIRKYRAWIMSQPELMKRAKKGLRRRIVDYWCKPEVCHGDILAEIADTD